MFDTKSNGYLKKNRQPLARGSFGTAGGCLGFGTRRAAVSDIFVEPELTDIEDEMNVSILISFAVGAVSLLT